MNLMGLAGKIFQFFLCFIILIALTHTPLQSQYVYLEKPGREARLKIDDYFELKSVQVLDSSTQSLMHKEFYGTLDSINDSGVYMHVLSWEVKYKLEGKTVNRDKVYLGHGKETQKHVHPDEIIYISRAMNPKSRANQAKRLGYSSLFLLTGGTTTVVSLFLKDKKERRNVRYAGFIQMIPFVTVLLTRKSQRRYYFAGKPSSKTWTFKK